MRMGQGRETRCCPVYVCVRACVCCVCFRERWLDEIWDNAQTRLLEQGHTSGVSNRDQNVSSLEQRASPNSPVTPDMGERRTARARTKKKQPAYGATPASLNSGLRPTIETCDYLVQSHDVNLKCIYIFLVIDKQPVLNKRYV